MDIKKTVKDCAVEIICKEGDKLTNKQIAAKVRDLMNSNTSEKSISMYPCFILLPILSSKLNLQFYLFYTFSFLKQ